MAYGNGRFVAVGSGTILTSDDGVNWTPRDGGAGAFLVDVTYGGGRFVAVGEGGEVLTSADGLEWSVGQAIGDARLSGLAYGEVAGEGLYVAVGAKGVEGEGAVFTSRDPDTVAWSVYGFESGGPLVFPLMAVTFGEGRFVAVDNGTRVLTTTNGQDWTVQETAAAGSLRHVAYGGGRFVAVGMRTMGSTGDILTSVDGVNWTSDPAPPEVEGDFSSVAYGGRFVVLGDSAILASEQAPLAVDDAYTTGAGTLSVSQPGVLRNDADPEADPITALLVSPPAHGTVSLNVYGLFEYTPELGFSGSDTFAYKATDGWLESEPATVTIQVDGSPPNWPGGRLDATLSAEHTEVTLTWTPATDNVGVVNYAVYRDGSRIDTVPGTVYTSTVTGLTPGTTYTFRVEAGDGAGNWSTDGPSTTVRTEAPMRPDTTPPSWPSGASLSATNVTPTGVVLRWPAATDDVGVVQYAVYRDGTLVNTVAGHVYTYAVPNLTPETTYRFQVLAADAAGNWTADGPSITVTTAPAPTGDSGGSSRPHRGSGELCPSLPRVTCAIIDPSQRAVVRESGGEFTLEIPAGAIDAPPGRTVRVRVTSLTPEETASLWPGTAPPSFRAAGQTYEIRAEVLTAARGAEVTDLALPAVFRVRAPAGDAARGIEPAKLGLFRLGRDGSLSFAGGRLRRGRWPQNWCARATTSLLGWT